MIRIFLNESKRYNEQTQQYEYVLENLVNEAYYAGFTLTSQNGNETFKAGNTICNTAKVTLANESFSEIPTRLIIEETDGDDGYNNIFVGNVDSYQENDFTTEFTLTDNMINFNFPYNASDIMPEQEGVIQPVSLEDIFNDICKNANVGISDNLSTYIQTMYQHDMQVNWFDNTYTARQYLEFIAEINCISLFIDGDGKLDYYKINLLKDMTIENMETEYADYYQTFDEIANYKIGTRHMISRVVFDDSNVYYAFGDETGETYYINYQNVYCINEDIVQHIFEELNGMVFYDFETDNIYPMSVIEKKCPPVFPFAFTNGETLYKTFISFDGWNYSREHWHGGTKYSVKNEKQQETEVIDQMKIIRGLKTVVDRDHNTITNVATQTETNRQTLETFQESVETQLSEQALTINSIQSSVSAGVETLKNSLVTIDINGINVSTNTSAISTLMTNEKFVIKSGDTTLAYFGYDDDIKSTKAEMDNLTVTNYLVTGYHRIEKYEADGEQRTGFFWIGE